MAKQITLDKVNAYYGGFRAIADISLIVEPRSITAFIGPSGLRQVDRAADHQPDARGHPRHPGRGAGPARRRGRLRPVHDPVEVRRRVGMVFQRPNPFPTMSIAENVVAGLKLNGRLGKKQGEEVVEKSLRGANLWNEVKDRLDRPGRRACPAGSSSGCASPGPSRSSPRSCSWTSPARPWTRSAPSRSRTSWRSSRRDYTIVIVTHNMQQAARVSDRTAFFSIEATGEPGRLVEIDDTKQIFSNPNEKKTEDYITGRFG